MSKSEQIELLKAARKRARQEYVLAQSKEDRLQWLEMSINLLEKIYVLEKS